jgi:fructose-1,6-bisphosphatase/inositol monophosphatase family enzyme
MVKSLEELDKIVLIALERAYRVHQELGASGEIEVQKNQFGNTALKVDIDCEKAVIDTFRENNVPIRIISEEHGTTDITDNPKYLAVLDGLDGTREYKRNRGKGRYVTMIGIFSNIDPTYDDYFCSGVFEHVTKRMYFASKGKGSFITIAGNQEPIHCSGQKSLNQESTRIYVDEVFDRSRENSPIGPIFLSKLKGHLLLHESSSGIHYVDLVSGKADLVLECTRKGNLEIATAYGLITESGGLMVTLEGTSLGKKKYLEFGQDRYIPIISASTRELAGELIAHIGK